MQIISDKAVGQALSGSQTAIYVGSLPSDQWAQVTVATWDFVADGDGVQLYVRRSGPGPYSAYLLSCTTGPNTNNGHMTLTNVGVGQLFSVSLSFAVNDTFLLAAQGTTISAYRKGTLVQSATDTSLTAGKVGMGVVIGGVGSTGVTDMGLTNFQAGYITGGGTGYSVPDCRNFAHFPNNPRDVQGTLIYDVPQSDSRTAGAPVDSRTVAPVDSRGTNAGTTPINSRTPGLYGPNE